MCAANSAALYAISMSRLNYAGDRNDAKNLAIILLLTKFDYGTASAVGLAEVQISSLIGREV
jgi:hypothetical protein